MRLSFVLCFTIRSPVASDSIMSARSERYPNSSKEGERTDHKTLFSLSFKEFPLLAMSSLGVLRFLIRRRFLFMIVL